MWELCKSRNYSATEHCSHPRSIVFYSAVLKYFTLIEVLVYCLHFSVLNSLLGLFFFFSFYGSYYAALDDLELSL